ncbi:hypothetical protein FKW77_007008 [Venturia effusa]|uniref:AP-1 complex subunit sigma-1 n=1 Tax=Venturia effusa TaxID=50376 RepID=A0A517LKH0_9PEZI|nr:hypothetical protein FKW77_007008 [Venturia effusa]
MAIRYLILLSRQGKVRLAKWFSTLSPKDKAKIVKDVSQLVLARRTRMCNFLEYKDTKIVYRRYASLFFIAGIDSTDNELITLEIVHRFVEQMDKYYGNVCELDIIFNFQKAYFILDELLLAGEMQESSKKNVLRCIGQQDSLEDMEADTSEMQVQFSSPGEPLSMLTVRQYMPLRNFDIVDAALNFENEGVIIEGGCDLFTCKPTKDDKKLEFKLENELDEDYQRSLRMAVAFAQSESVRKSSSNSRHSHPIPPNLARASPFGPLSVRANRRKFGYMLSTLNACHPDHDFFKAPKPYEFSKERSLDDVVNAFDDKILGAHGMRFQSGLHTPGGSFLWGIKMWRIIDSEMDIEKCDIYSWNPKENPLDDFEPSFWSLHYFFHNKSKKRVTYLHARALKTCHEWGSDVYTTPKSYFADRDSTDNESGEASPIRIQEEDIEETFVDVELLEEIIKRSRSDPRLAVDLCDSHSEDSH